MSAHPPGWCAQYVGLPYVNKGRGPEAYDCWGLVRRILAEQFDVYGVADYAGAYTDAKDQASVAAAVDAARQEWQQVATPEAGDVVILRLAGRPWHCGLAVGGAWMIHCQEATGVVLERFDRAPWTNRIEGFFRHV